MTSSVLTLNAGMVPIGTCSVEQSIKMLYEGVAHAVLDTARVMRSPSVSIPVPAVVRLPGMTFVPEKRVAFSNLNVIYRDDQRCQYCGKRMSIEELTIDHIIPRSRFEPVARKRRIRYAVNSWENCVASCSRCNGIKDDRLLEESGIRLMRPPREPEFRPHVVMTRNEAKRRNWLEFLEPFQRFTVLLLT